ncbi:DNA protection protein DPS [Actinomadura soli]|uniref:DNA protection protein DPS n=1 Tax=Actinomadura soli TaxID=2508997 RepID=A0A5C4JDT0_9ACTN|nr:ferritin-like domain-containing protein [Actinomadura soli]TMR02218.1 DNA protection protein DPS [Actinomadura soli]
MSGIARELVERAGVDVDVLIQRLTAAARAKLAAHYRYTILHAGLATLMGARLQELLMDVRAEHHNHFDVLVTRIYELDGRLPDDLGHFAATDLADENLPDGIGDSPDALVTALIDSTRRATRIYTHLCELTEDKDLRTYDLAQAILFEESEHEAWFYEFLGTGPPPRFQRGFRGRSPYVTRLPASDPADPDAPGP